MEENEVNVDFTAGETTPLTANEIAQLELGETTMEQIEAARAASQGAEPAPEAPIEPSEEPAADPTPAPAADPTPAPTPTFDFTKFGVQSEDELSALLAERNTLKAERDSITKKAELIGQIERPYANDAIAKINSVVKELGINNISIASELVGMTDETLKADPIKTLALAKIVQDPTVLNTLTMSELYQAVAQKAGIDPDDVPQDLPPLVKLEVAEAAKLVQQKVNGLTTAGSEIFANLETQRLQAQQKFEAAKTQWGGFLDTAVSQKKELTLTENGVQFKVAVSPEQVQHAKEAALDYAVRNGAELTAENQKAINDFVDYNLFLANREQAFKSYHTAIEGNVREQLTKEFHNGAPVTRQDKPAAEGQVQKSPHIVEAERFLKENGVVMK